MDEVATIEKAKGAESRGNGPSTKIFSCMCEAVQQSIVTF